MRPWETVCPRTLACPSCAPAAGFGRSPPARFLRRGNEARAGWHWGSRRWRSGSGVCPDESGRKCTCKGRPPRRGVFLRKKTVHTQRVRDSLSLLLMWMWCAVPCALLHTFLSVLSYFHCLLFFVERARILCGGVSSFLCVASTCQGIVGFVSPSFSASPCGCCAALRCVCTPMLCQTHVKHTFICFPFHPPGHSLHFPEMCMWSFLFWTYT